LGTKTEFPFLPAQPLIRQVPAARTKTTEEMLVTWLPLLKEKETVTQT
jgi:hypothetical protein